MQGLGFRVWGFRVQGLGFKEVSDEIGLPKRGFRRYKTCKINDNAVRREPLWLHVHVGNSGLYGLGKRTRTHTRTREANGRAGGT